MKIVKWLIDHSLFLVTLFLLMFIPLYPKVPLFDVAHTWVYIRMEDVLVGVVLVLWFVMMLRKKITLRTPLTLPILIFWICGALATIHGILLVFPGLSDVFPNVAFLSFLRRVEYMSAFFIAFAGMKDKQYLKYVVTVLIVTLLIVVGYGIGQKYGLFPAFLTMNEEFAKGEPIYLSSLSRVSSTFAGHYDLAAYLVLIIPILTSMIFGFRNWLMRLVLLITSSFGFVLLFMTVSRVSFFVLVISLFLVLFLQKKRLVLFSLPVIVLCGFLFLSTSTSLLDRFGSTIKEVDVLVDAKTGEAIGNVKIVPKTSFKNKLIKQKNIRDKNELDATLVSKKETVLASPSAILLYEALPEQLPLVVAANISTGESLPQGTGYINLSLSPVRKKLGEFFYEKTIEENGSSSTEVLVVYGQFLLKKASAYDLSFTTRFQGEWPRALAAFKRNVIFGSGYGSVGLAVDNNYLRILGETGILGFVSFAGIFIALGIYIKKVLPHVDSKLVRSFVLGFVAGVVGLALNATLIDVFEASKIAFLLWLLTGVTVGMLSFYQKDPIRLYQSLKNVATSTYAITLYIFVLVILILSPMLHNYFSGDDFTWFRWVSDCSQAVSGTNQCPSFLTRIADYFVNAGGFFYRPGTKVYFLLMHSLFWLNQTVYHGVSLFLHASVAILFFFLARKVMQSAFFAALAVLLFLILSGYSEAVFWTSATGYLFNAFFILLSVLLFILWEEKRKRIYFFASLVSMILSMLFHELGVVAPLFVILYKYLREEKFVLARVLTDIHYLTLFVPVLFYLPVRFLAQSHWFQGDYSYNLLKLPFNFIGNAAGYISLIMFGPASLSAYTTVRNISKEHVLFGVVISVGILVLLAVLYRFLFQKLKQEERKLVIFGVLFFIIALLPFLGLGNITSRYSYLASMGILIIFVFFLRKLYYYLLSNGRDIALAVVITLIASFSLFHIMQLQQVHRDWREAGEKSRRFFISIDEVYDDYWSTEPMEFHFVNVPTKQGEAWIFSVGMEDALWLVFRNPNIKVHQWSTVEDALSAIDDPKKERAFIFDESGRVSEKKKMPTVQ